MEITGFDSPPHTPLDKSNSEVAKFCVARGCSTSQSAVGWNRGLIDVVYNAISVMFFHAFPVTFPERCEFLSSVWVDIWKRCWFVAQPEVKCDWCSSSKSAHSQPLALSDAPPPPHPLTGVLALRVLVILSATNLKNWLNSVNLAEQQHEAPWLKIKWLTFSALVKFLIIYFGNWFVSPDLALCLSGPNKPLRASRHGPTG